MNLKIKSISFVPASTDLKIKSINFTAPAPRIEEITDADQFLAAIVEEMSAGEDDYVI